MEEKEIPPKKRNVEDVLLDGAKQFLDFFQPEPQTKKDLQDFVGDQSNKNRKPPFGLI